MLIIEDERPMAKALSLKFEKLGWKVQVATDGKEGIDKLKKEKFNVALVDLIMPNIDGFAVLKWVKENKITTPVIVSSNLGQQDDISKAQEMGAVDYLIKSEVSISEIIERVKKVIGG